MSGSGGLEMAFDVRPCSGTGLAQMRMFGIQRVWVESAGLEWVEWVRGRLHDEHPNPRLRP